MRSVGFPARARLRHTPAVTAVGLAAVAALAAFGPAGPGGPAAVRIADAASAEDGTAPFDVESDPAGAKVLVDGREVGTTPVSDHPLAAGRRTIRLELPEHEAFETVVEATAGGRVRVPLVRLVPWPKLVVDAKGPDVAVTLDGAAPVASGRVAPGPRTVVLTRPGFAPQTHRIEVASGRDATVTAAPWERFQSRIDLSRLPKDAVAQYEGARVSGVLTFSTPSKGTLRLTRPGHFAQTIAVDLALGESLVAGEAWTVLPAVATARAKGTGDPSANLSLKAGLDWLARHQAKDGRWDCDGFPDACPERKCPGEGESVFDPGVSGLALLAFLGAGETHVEGRHAATVAKGLTYLGDIQDAEGCFGPRTSQHFQFNHAASAAAAVEAYWLTNDKKVRAVAANGVRFTLASQNPYLAWRYGVRDGDNDTPATIYQSLVLRTAEWTDLAPTPDWRKGALSWIDKMTDPTEGRTGYQSRGGRSVRYVSRGTRARPFLGDTSRDFPEDGTETLTAGALLVRRLLAEPDDEGLVPLGSALVARSLPFEPKGWIDLHGALWGSLVHAQDPKGGLADWRKKTVAEIVSRQVPKEYACAAGSWEASKDPFGAFGGRVYTTAMSVLALEAPSRFPVVPQPPRKPSKPVRR